MAAPAILAALAVAGGCTDADPEASLSMEVVRTTHPDLGVPVITSGAGLAERELGWEVSAEPELVLGAVESGPEAELFAQIAGAKQRRDGTLFVVEGDFDEVRVFDRDGRHRETLGRSGDGPEEFRIPRMVQTPDHFDIRIWDRSHRRMLTVDRDLEFGEPRTIDRSYGDPLGLVQDTVMSRHIVVLGTRQPGRLDWPVRYYAVPPEGEAILLDSLPDPMFVTMSEMGGRAVPSMENVVFAARPIEAMHFNSLVVAPGPAPELHWYRADGSVERIQSVDLVPDPATREGVLEYRRNRLRSVDAEVRDEFLEAYRLMPLVDRIAAFDDLLVDTEGHIWARMYRRDETQQQNRWLVFAPGGALRGYVDLPHLDDIYQIGPDFMLGRTIDDLGVQQVVRYGLTR